MAQTSSSSSVLPPSKFFSGADVQVNHEAPGLQIQGKEGAHYPQLQANEEAHAGAETATCIMNEAATDYSPLTSDFVQGSLNKEIEADEEPQADTETHPPILTEEAVDSEPLQRVFGQVSVEIEADEEPIPCDLDKTPLDMVQSPCCSQKEKEAEQYVAAENLNQQHINVMLEAINNMAAKFNGFTAGYDLLYKNQVELVKVLTQNNLIMTNMGKLLHHFFKSTLTPTVRSTAGPRNSVDPRPKIFTTVPPMNKVIQVDSDNDDPAASTSCLPARKRTHTEAVSPVVKKKGTISISSTEQPELRLCADSLLHANKWNQPRTWVALNDTYVIKIQGEYIANYIRGKSDLGLVLSRALTHMLQYKEGLKRDDDRDYCPTHYFTAGRSFIRSSRGNDLDAFMQALHHYNQQECHTFVALVESQKQWACYSFYMTGKVETIIDPMSGNSSHEEIIEKHKAMLHKVKCKVVEFWCRVNKDKFLSPIPWKTKTINDDTIKSGGSESGLFAFLAGQNVHAENGTMDSFQVTSQNKYILPKFNIIDELLQMPRNMAVIP